MRKFKDPSLPYYNSYGIKFHLKEIICPINHETNKGVKEPLPHFYLDPNEIIKVFSGKESLWKE